MPRVQRGTFTQVAKAWSEGKPAISTNNNFSTDGNTLYSYNLVIGYKDSEVSILEDYSASGYFISHQTSKHVNAAKEYATIIKQPLR